jgi:hypothetical protein
MSKPVLPLEIQQKLPVEVVKLIHRYVPRYPKALPHSPGLQRALESLQKSPKRSAMDLYGLDDFILN